MSAEAFERAFVAATYLLGQRDALADGLSGPGPAAERTASLLGEPDRAKRAQRLAAELVPMVKALDGRRLV